MPCKVGKGKKQREKLCRYFCKDKSLEKFNTQGNQSRKGKGLGAHEAVGKLLAPEQNVSILKSTYNNQHPWQGFPIPFLFLFPKQQSGNGCVNKGEGTSWPTKEFKKGIISKSTLRPGALDVPKNNPRHPDQVNIPIPVVPTSHSNSGTL